MISSKYPHITDAYQILVSLGLPVAQLNERSALCLLALINLTVDKNWGQAENPLMGITPIMDWIRDYYQKNYAPNTRETFRRQTMHQFRDAGIVFYNPDDPGRAINSPKTVYQVTSVALDLFRSFGTSNWDENLLAYLAKNETLILKYAKERQQNCIPVQLSLDKKILLSPGEHSKLIQAIINEFARRFVPNGILIYVGDTGNKEIYFDSNKLSELGVHVDLHGKMPDVVFYYPERNWLLLVESVTSHGPVDGKRHVELGDLFSNSHAGLVYVTAFPNFSIMSRFLPMLAWETEVWVADAPSHLIHFNGDRFLGPYAEEK